jgi:hypothetical protein
MRTTIAPPAENTFKIKPATPIEIQRIDLFFELPPDWLDFVTSADQGRDLDHVIDCFVTGARPGRLYPTLKPIEDIDYSIAGFGDVASLALKSEIKKGVWLLIRQDIWELFLIQCENVGQSPLFVLMILIAEDMHWEKKNGPELRASIKAMNEAESRKLAAHPILPSRVVPGPWNAQKNLSKTK